MKCPQASCCTSRPPRGRTVERMQGQELLDEVAARMKTEEGRNEYKRRKQTVEPRHADMRTHRGLQRFHGYGQSQAQSQVGLLVLAPNGLTLYKLRRRKFKAAGPPREQRKPMPPSPPAGASLAGGRRAAPPRERRTPIPPVPETLRDAPPPPSAP